MCLWHITYVPKRDTKVIKMEEKTNKIDFSSFIGKKVLVRDRIASKYEGVLMQVDDSFMLIRTENGNVLVRTKFVQSVSDAFPIEDETGSKENLTYSHS
jgi:kynurenine formamidase